MCDTFVALGDATPSGAPLFGKNSDREPFEAQGVEWIPAQRHAADARVHTTSLELPQVPRTHAVLLSRPYWMWGAEMGVNEHGVVAGNEAVFTRIAAERRRRRARGETIEPGLLGMDVLRLCLERADTAQAAAELASELIEVWGQGGEAGHRVRNFDYDNSFLFADRTSAWTVESAGSAWVRRQVAGIYAISNRLRVRDDWQFASAHINAYARDRGLAPGRGRLDFARTFRDRLFSAAAMGHTRQARVECLLAAGRGALTAGFGLGVLRDHAGRGPDPRRAQVCAHGGWLPQRRAAQTTASLVVDFGQSTDDLSGLPVWLTGTSAPCSSLFKPGWLSAERAPGWLPDFPAARADASLWWQHQRLLRWARRDWPRFLAEIQVEQRALEQDLLHRTSSARTQSADQRDEMSRLAWRAADSLERRWREWAEAQLREGSLGPNDWYLRNLERQVNLA